MLKKESEKYRKFFRSNMDFYLDILSGWVGINSFTINREGVNRLGELSADPFVKLGFAVERIPSTNSLFGDHFVLSRKGSSEKSIGLVSHLDTVFPLEEEVDNNFSWREDGDRIYGPGTIDIKGGTLLIFMLVHALREFDLELFESISWNILLDASEETMSEDFGDLCRSKLAGSTACLVFEGGFYDEETFKVVQMRKGMAKFRIRVDGKAAHAGVAHPDGANAIVQLSESIRRIAEFTNYEKNITFNVGSIHGGTVPNRVPHFAEAIGEMRAFEEGVFNEGVQMLKSLEEQIDVVSLTGAACQVSVDIYEQTRPWPKNEGTEGLINIWQETAKSLGYRVFPEARGGLSDGNHTWDFVPTVDGLGPGGGNAHCSVHDPDAGIEQEYLHKPSVLPKAVLNIMAVKALLERAES